MGQELVKSASSAARHTSSGHRYGRRHAFVGFRPDRLAPDSGAVTPASSASSPALPASPRPVPASRDTVSTLPVATRARRRRRESDVPSLPDGVGASGRSGSDDDPSPAVVKREPRRSTAAVTGGAIPKVRGKCGKRSRSSNEDSSSGCDVSGFKWATEAADADDAAGASEGRPERETGQSGGEARNGRQARRFRETASGGEARKSREARQSGSGRDARSDRVGRGGNAQTRRAKEGERGPDTRRNSGGEARSGVGDARRRSSGEAGRVAVIGSSGSSGRGKRIVGGEQSVKVKMRARAARRSSSSEARGETGEVAASGKKRSNAKLTPSSSSREARSSSGERSSGDDESGVEARGRGETRLGRRVKAASEAVGSVGGTRGGREARSGRWEAGSGAEAEVDVPPSVLSLIPPWVRISRESDGDDSSVAGDGVWAESNDSSWETLSVSLRGLPLTGCGGSSNSSSISDMDIDYNDYDDDDDDLIDVGTDVLGDEGHDDDHDEDHDEDRDDGDNELRLFIRGDGYPPDWQQLGLRESTDGLLAESLDGDESEGEAAAAFGDPWVEIKDLVEESWRSLVVRPSSWVLREEELRLSGNDGDDEDDGGGVAGSDDYDDDDDDDDDASEGETFSLNFGDASISSTEFVPDLSLTAEVFHTENYPMFAWQERLSAVIESTVADLQSLIADFNGIQSQPAPASSDLISSLPVCFLKENVSEQSCTICCSEFVRADRATTLPCRHLFHTACIRQWLEKSATCPVCRYHLVEEDGAAAPSRPPPHYRGSGQRL